MQLELRESKTWSGPAGREGLRVRVSSGTVWVTQEADPEDHVLAGPGVFDTRPRGRVVVYALTPATVEVDPEGAPIH
ncbi:MAG TPA: DUF2917 domain-containing protein [Anaeromyxobacter sp.]|nr:DUF2917 domain-containing protein [Anaeromyxobacter sp.]